MQLQPAASCQHGSCFQAGLGGLPQTRVHVRGEGGDVAMPLSGGGVRPQRRHSQNLKEGYHCETSGHMTQRPGGGEPKRKGGMRAC
jgi:hypothetical protein